MEEYKKFAFISYSHRDLATARWLQKRLESFKLPTDIHNEIETGCRYLRPVFRDQSDLNTGILTNELHRNLKESKFLILLCSRNSAQSQWVSEEAQAFVEMGRLDRIIPVIIPDGSTPERELFPEYLRNYFKDNPESELLGVNIGEVGREKALIRVVSRMLGIDFDALWRRHLRQRRLRTLYVTMISIVILSMLYLFAVPVKLNLRFEEQYSALPAGEDITINVNGAEYRTPLASGELRSVRLPGYKRFSKVEIMTAAEYFETVDTMITPGLGLSRSVVIPLRRDDTFSTFAGTIFDPDLRPIEGVMVEVAGYSAITDGDGHFAIVLPVEKQLAEHSISVTKEGYLPIIREDESPGASLRYILHTN